MISIKKEQVLSYLNGRVKDLQLDPGKRWKTTWNHYLSRINLFFKDIQLPFAASNTALNSLTLSLISTTNTLSAKGILV